MSWAPSSRLRSRSSLVWCRGCRSCYVRGLLRSWREKAHDPRTTLPTDRSRDASFHSGTILAGNRHMAVAQRFQATSRLQSPFAPSDFARDVAPLAALYVTIAATIQQLRRARPDAARPVARFINLFLVSLVTGNGVGGERFVHAPLSGLAPDRYLEAERRSREVICRCSQSCLRQSFRDSRCWQ